MPRKTKRHAYGRNVFKSRAWDATNYIRSLDSFAKEVPAFNINGQSHVQTLVGGFLTSLIIIITFSYATSKMIDLAQKKDPFVTLSEEKDFYDASKGINLNQANFRFAIGA